MNKIVYYRPHEFFWLETLSGTASIGWAAYVYFLNTPLDDFPAYEVLSEYLPNGFWCLVATLCGITQIIWTAIPCFVEAPPRLVSLATKMRFVAAWIMLLWWKILGVSLLKSGYPAPMSIISLTLGCFHIPIIVKLLPGLIHSKHIY